MTEAFTGITPTDIPVASYGYQYSIPIAVHGIDVALNFAGNAEAGT